MKYEKTCSQGSFIAWGTGFRFEYEAPDKLLGITPLDRKSAIAKLRFDQRLAESPLAYVESLNKTNQIKALMYSNNATANLAETLDRKRIGSLIKSTARISRFAFDLRTKNFDRFSWVFCKDFDLESLAIKQVMSKRKHKAFFMARLQTRYNNCVCVRGRTLSALVARLSDKTLSDLITMEFGHSYNNSAHRLLNASSKLSTISRILDENFIPEHKLGRYKGLKSPITNAQTTAQKGS